MYYLRKDYGILRKNDRIEIIFRRKIGKKTYLDVRDINNTRINRVPSNILRKRPT